ncbi:MAG: TolB family protein, partial [Pirellulaceae bacterium]
MTIKPDTNTNSSTHVLSLVPILLLAAVVVGGLSWYLARNSQPTPVADNPTTPVVLDQEPETQEVTAAVKAPESDDDEEHGEDNFFTNVRQRTSTGLRSGEGYFSADGKRMVFQSERSPENPFYQIFVMDFDMGDVIPISPGHGKTTCAWIHPDGQRVMYASTQDDPDSLEKQKAKLELRATGKDSRYNWDYDEHYELYAYDLAAKEYTKLTDAVGYDAEDSYSPDGTKIAFASNRRAYIDGELVELEQQQFDFHQAAVMDIYIMDADG